MTSRPVDPFSAERLRPAEEVPSRPVDAPRPVPRASALRPLSASRAPSLAAPPAPPPPAQTLLLSPPPPPPAARFTPVPRTPLAPATPGVVVVTPAALAPAPEPPTDPARACAGRLLLGCLVAELRDRARMSGAQLARTAGLRAHLVYAIERGRLEAAQDMRRRLNEALQVDLDALTGATWACADAAVRTLRLPARWWTRAPLLVASLCRVAAIAAVSALAREPGNGPSPGAQGDRGA